MCPPVPAHRLPQEGGGSQTSGWAARRHATRQRMMAVIPLSVLTLGQRRLTVYSRRPRFSADRRHKARSQHRGRAAAARSVFSEAAARPPHLSQARRRSDSGLDAFPGQGGVDRLHERGRRRPDRALLAIPSHGGPLITLTSRNFPGNEIAEPETWQARNTSGRAGDNDPPGQKLTSLAVGQQVRSP